MLRLICRPAELRQADKGHPWRTPVIDDVRKHINVHEQGVGLACKQGAPFTIHVSQAHGGLTGIRARAKQVEFKFEYDRRAAVCWHLTLHTEATLFGTDA